MFIKMKFTEKYSKEIKKISLAIGVIGASVLIFSRYKVANSSQYLVRTVLGINEHKITKKGFHWPGQNISYIEMTPTVISVNVPTMCKERVPFLYSSTWTIGPKDDLKSLNMYACTLNKDYKDTVAQIIKNETQVLTTTYEQIDDELKNAVKTKITSIMDDLGLKVYNVNTLEIMSLNELRELRELRDMYGDYICNKQCTKQTCIKDNNIPIVNNIPTAAFMAQSTLATGFCAGLLL